MLKQSLDLIFLLGALVAFYISSRAAADALDSSDAPSPGRQALGYALPVAAVALGAAAAGHTHLAVAVVFSTSVAALMLVAALCILVAPSPQIAARNAWTLFLPAALMAWIVGFGANLSWLAIAALLIEGVVILIAWNRPEPADAATAPSARRGSSMILRVLQLLLCLLLAVIGVWAIIHAGSYVTRHSYFVTGGLFASVVIAPLLALPMIGAGVAQVQRGQLHIALGSQIGVALLNVCLILPLVGVTAWVFHHQQPMAAIPLGTWRIDAVALVVLGLLLLCLGTRILHPTKLLGGILLIGYLAYLMLCLRAALGV